MLEEGPDFDAEAQSLESDGGRGCVEAVGRDTNAAATARVSPGDGEGSSPVRWVLTDGTVELAENGMSSVGSGLHLPSTGAGTLESSRRSAGTAEDGEEVREKRTC